jgi:cytochrome P450
MNDISMHLTSYTVQNAILDLATADPSLGYIEALRAESARLLKETGRWWTRQALRKLELVDSVVRESMRLTPFSSVGLPRTVISHCGLTVQQGKDKSFHVTFGTVLAIPVDPIYFGDMIYPNAKQLQPFRFTQPGAVRDIIDDAASASTAGEGLGSNGHVSWHYTTPATTTPVESSKNQKKKSATVDDAFLGFGFQGHACPGRFFAINEVKIFRGTHGPTL